MASEFAARIRAKLTRRRHSFVSSSMGSSQSTGSVNSQNQRPVGLSRRASHLDTQPENRQNLQLEMQTAVSAEPNKSAKRKAQTSERLSDLDTCDGPPYLMSEYQSHHTHPLHLHWEISKDGGNTVEAAATHEARTAGQDTIGTAGATKPTGTASAAGKSAPGLRDSSPVPTAWKEQVAQRLSLSSPQSHLYPDEAITRNLSGNAKDCPRINIHDSHCNDNDNNGNIGGGIFTGCYTYEPDGLLIPGVGAGNGSDPHQPAPTIVTTAASGGIGSSAPLALFPSSTSPTSSADNDSVTTTNTATNIADNHDLRYSSLPPLPSSSPPHQLHKPKCLPSALNSTGSDTYKVSHQANLSGALSGKSTANICNDITHPHKSASDHHIDSFQIIPRTPLETNDDNHSGSYLPSIRTRSKMLTRKIWVKRPSASPTLITINEDDLVDNVRDLILRKYANSLGKVFDSPDLTIRIVPRDRPQQSQQQSQQQQQQFKERLLGPEEHMCRTLDHYYPGGQFVSEALIIDIPVRRTPKHSPRAPAMFYVTEDGRPSENGEGYFPPVAVAVGGLPSPHHGVTQAPTNGAVSHSISVLGTGHIPPIPSPGGTRRAFRERSDRPRLPARTHTSSPTVISNSAHHAAGADPANHGMQHYTTRPTHSRAHSSSSDQKNLHSVPPAMPTSPVSQGPAAPAPPPRLSSPRPSTTRIKKTKKTTDYPSLPAGMLNGSVPPISVLIVEDNPINLRLLEAFVKRLKVRWQTAMNGREAVEKWRTGGFHLVLMDIQLPVMNGLDATREIRRLESVNSIGVFTSTNSQPEESNSVAEPNDQDRLENMELFKSPVIIVALTASSLQSDRHDALAAGCNDFLTKPVNFVWLERKVMEWGCMQALIDFDGWRTWKSISHQPAKASSTTATGKAKPKKNKPSSLSSST